MTIELKKSNQNSIEEYINVILDKCDITIPIIKKHTKTMDVSNMPTIFNYQDMINNNYNITQLKQFAKHYKLKISGNKPQLISRIYCFLHLSFYIIKIQKTFRGYLVKKYKQLRGPAIIERKICTNHDDFVTMEPINEIPFNQFISYKDTDGFIYGFDIASLYNLFLKTKTQINNPYNRNPMPKYVFKNISLLLKISKILQLPVNLGFENVMNNVTLEKMVEFKTVKLFQEIDALGNYSNPEWFLSLNLFEIKKFAKELFDIWHYRAKLSPEMKSEICPPIGKPFREISLHFLNTEKNIWSIKNTLLVVLNKFINSGTNKDNKTLGAYYVLAALTIVNSDAATSLPWLYESVRYI